MFAPNRRLRLRLVPWSFGALTSQSSAVGELYPSGGQTRAMTLDQLRSIESALAITLPDAYRSTMAAYPWQAFHGSAEASLWDDPEPIIDQTRAYRSGFGGAPPWPTEFVVIGDEDDACPYAINCTTGRIIQTDHGNLKKTPLQEFDQITDLVSELRKTYDGLVRKPRWKIW